MVEYFINVQERAVMYEHIYTLQSTENCSQVFF